MDDASLISMPMTAERNGNISGIFKGIRSQLLGFIKKRVSSNEDAEDILQDVFYQFTGNTEPIEQVSSWLYTVTRNKITDRYRKKKLPLADDVLNDTGAEDELSDWREFLFADNSTPETDYLRSLFWETLQQALSL